MKKILFVFCLASVSLFAQETEKENLKKTEEALTKVGEEGEHGWTRKGVFTALANQSSFDNWLAGGQNNFAGNVGVNYDFNYKNADWNWDNKLIVAYGLTKIKGADTQKQTTV